MQKDAKKLKILSILWPILSTIIILLGATLIYLYANGYRFNFSNQQFKRTGVISVESEPFLADMYINNKSIGRTPESKSLEIGTYKISVAKELYTTWDKDIQIVEGKITPVFPFLLLSDIKGESVWNTDEKFLKFWGSDNHNTFLFLTQDTKSKIYTLWSYSISTSILDFSTNPMAILSTTNGNISIVLSSDGNKAIFIQKGTKVYTPYLLDTRKNNILGSTNILNITNPELYTISWAKDNKKLILENSTEISSYNIEKQTNTRIINKIKNTEYIWTTDKEGYFYLCQELLEDDLDNVYIYKISQMTINGTVTSKNLIDKIYFLKSDEYIKQYREGDTSTLCEFTNSPECTQTAGKITKLDINQDSEGIFISTTLSSYWYFFNTKKYQMISPYPSDVIEYSPDNYKFIFKNEKGYGIFTIKKQKEDHTVNIGSKEIRNISDITKIKDIKWVSDSLHMYYIEDSIIYFTDIDGENKTKLIESENLIGFSIEYSRENLELLINSTEGLNIYKYRIH